MPKHGQKFVLAAVVLLQLPVEASGLSQRVFQLQPGAVERIGKIIGAPPRGASHCGLALGHAFAILRVK